MANKSYQGVCLGLLKVVAPINRIKPSVQEELAPFSVANDEAPNRQPVLVLRENKVHVLPGKVGKCLDDAVWRDNGMVLLHEVRQLGRLHNVVLNLQLRVHHEGVLVQIPEEVGLGILGESMAHGHHFGPRSRRTLQIIVADIGKERLISCQSC